MDSGYDNAYMEIFDLLRQRDRICDEWMSRVERNLREKRISADEALDQMRRIKEERTKNKEIFSRISDKIDNLKIREK